MIFIDEMPSPIGKLTLVCNDAGITHVHMDCGRLDLPPATRGHPLLADARTQLAEYFAGTRVEFTLPLAAEGTPFRQRVWAALCEIPFAETCSYGELAAVIGSPKASRAVGAANGANPIGIIVPCHRVIGSDGTLAGYGGGLERKQWLLEHERKVAARLPLANMR